MDRVVYRVVCNLHGTLTRADAKAEVFSLQAAVSMAKHYREQEGSEGGVIRILDNFGYNRSSWRWRESAWTRETSVDPLLPVAAETRASS